MALVKGHFLTQLVDDRRDQRDPGFVPQLPVAGQRLVQPPGGCLDRETGFAKIDTVRRLGSGNQ